jgi:hypothetical protein
LPAPEFDIRTLPSVADSARGYLVVAVPRSATAPHQVISGKDYRYYGRGPTGNRILSEGEVALLYQRRDRWQTDRDEYLADVVRTAMFDPENELIYAHAFVRPVASDDELVERAASGGDVQMLLHELREEAASFAATDGYAPDLRTASSIRRRGADGWLLHDGLQTSERPHPSDVVYVDLDRNGTMRFFCGRVGATHNGQRLIFESSIAGNMAMALAIIGLIYRRADFVGEVDLGIAVTNLAGAVSTTVHRNGFWSGSGFGNEDYRRTARVSAQRLASEPRQVVLDLCSRMFEITLPSGADAFMPNRR